MSSVNVRTTVLMLVLAAFAVSERSAIAQGLSHTVAPDFDGDGKSDLALYRASDNTWNIRTSSSHYLSGYQYAWGAPGDIPMPGDYDGDGRTDITVYRPSSGHWFVLKSSSNFTTWITYQWGTPGDIPEPGDYDGDGKTDPAVYRPSTGTWYILTSSSGFTTGTVIPWGASTDIPVTGDYDGDGKTDLAVFRGAPGHWFILKSSTNYATRDIVPWGSGGDFPLAGDFDGDGKTDLTVWRGWETTPITIYFATSSSEYQAGFGYQWGSITWDPTNGSVVDMALTGDYDGDGKSDLVLFRRSTGHWFVLKSSTNFTQWDTYQFGGPGDKPVTWFLSSFRLFP